MATERKPERKKPLEFDELPIEGEVLGELIEAEADPYASVIRVAKETGLSDTEIAAMLRAMRAKHQPLLETLRDVKTGDLTRLLDDRAYAALAALDEEVFAKMAKDGKGKDLAIALGILLEKRQLLRGEPTHILSVDERRQLNELLPMMLREAERRGILIDATGEEVFALPAPPERSARPRSGNPSLKDSLQKAENRRKDEIGEPR